MSKVLLAKNGSDVETPPAGTVAVYARDDGKVYRRTDDGTVTELGGGSGSGSSLTVAEEDGSPSVVATTLKVPNGTLTDAGNGTARLACAAASHAHAANDITSGTLDGDRLPDVSGSSAGKVPATSGASDGDVLTVQADGTAAWEVPTSSSGGGGTNLLLNGSFNIWQRGLSLTGVSEYAYVPDRWYVLTQSAAVNVARQEGDTQRYACCLTQPNATTQRVGLAQIVEGVHSRHLRGDKATLSGRAKLSAAGNVRFAILAWTGPEDGTGTTNPAPHFTNADKELVNSWTSTTYTEGNFFVSSANFEVAGVGVVACDGSNWSPFVLTTPANLSPGLNNLIAFIWSEGAMAQNATLDLEAVQLEAGESASPFQLRDVTEELTMCRRYYERHTNISIGYYTLGVHVTSGSRHGNYPFKFYTDKRTIPVGAYSVASDFQVNDGTTTDVGTSVTIDLIGTQIFRFRLYHTTTNTAAGLTYLQAANANSWIGVDAEL
ncbi:MAG: hypothetical protein HC884_01485 [Chloroflexaceae bacterium]|nr:hypothetical protein [Chloroflexaceae bacterium]